MCCGPCGFGLRTGRESSGTSRDSKRNPVPEIISRDEAKARGLRRYFTGKPCKYGHVAERYIYAGCKCLGCDAAFRKENIQKILTKNRARYAANPKKGRAQCLAWRVANPATQMLNNMRHRARQGGFCCTITKEQMAQKLRDTSHCPVKSCGVSLKPNRGKLGPDSPSADRVSTRVGYTELNTRIICYRCNLIKRNCTAAQLRALADYIDENDFDWLALRDEFVPILTA